MKNNINPNHTQQKKRAHKLIKVIISCGLFFILLGGYLVFTHDSSDLENTMTFVPKIAVIGLGFFICFTSLPILLFTNIGAITRYQSHEVAPVGADTINYVGKKAKPGIQHIAHAIASGMAGENQDSENIPVDIRLSKLKDLYDKGLINKKEYDEKRGDILEDI